MTGDATNAPFVEPAARIEGHAAMFGDIELSHRALLIAALCDGETRIAGLGRNAATDATVTAVRQLGAWVYEHDSDTVRVGGLGLRGVREAPEPIECGEAITLVSLLAGILSGQSGTFRLAAGASLPMRPLLELIGPLGQLDARIEPSAGGLTLTIEGGELRPGVVELPAACAHVKSALLLAGLLALDGETTVVEPHPTVDHTESLLTLAGARVAVSPGRVRIRPADTLSLGELELPGDFSAAAPFIVAALLAAGSELHLHGVNLNPRRTGLLPILERMGARITIYNRRSLAGEPAGDLEVRSSELVGTHIGPAEITDLARELPLFALAASCARGDSVVRGASQVSGSERLDATAAALRAVGAHIRATDDGLRVRGVPSRPRGGIVDCAGDPSIAVLGAVSGLVSRDGVKLLGGESIELSFPGFFALLGLLRHA